MAIKPYQPSNTVTPSGFTWLLSAAIGSGVAIGSITQMIALVFYLVFLFPVLMGLGGGAAMALAVKQGKVRNPTIAALFGALSGVILYGTMNGVGYWQFKQATTAQIIQELGETDAADIDPMINGYLKEKTGATGFVGYLKSSAIDGVSIGKAGQKGINLGETGTWIYWLIELAIIDIMIAVLAYKGAKAAFCESCDQWYGASAAIGSVQMSDSSEFLSLIQNEHFQSAGKLLETIAPVPIPNLTVEAQCCSSCKISPLHLTVNAMSRNSKGNPEAKEMAQGLISLSQYGKLSEAAAARRSDFLAEHGNITAEAFQLAQQERSSVSATDRFEPHDLQPEAITKLVEQFTKHPIKQAYLVRKTVHHLKEQPFYVLAINRRIGFIDSEEAEPKLLAQLMTQLNLPQQTWIVCLNKQKAMAKAIQTIARQPIYARK
jgi:hypothetical protein